MRRYFQLPIQSNKCNRINFKGPNIQYQPANNKKRMQRDKIFEDLSISNFIFIITPTQAYFSRGTKNKRTLTLQKGMQTLGTLQQCIPLITKDSKKDQRHKFNAENHSIRFRVTNDKNLNYQWTVYKVLDGGELEQIDCVQFSIQNYWKIYVEEYEKNVANLLLRTKEEKDTKKTLEVWKELLAESSKRTDNMEVVFGNSNFRMDFKIQARSVLDEQLQQYQTQRVLKKLREAGKSNLRKSATGITNTGFDDFTSDQIKIIYRLRKGKTQEGDKLNPNMLSPNSRNYFLPIKDRDESIKKAHSYSEAVIVKHNNLLQKASYSLQKAKNSFEKANILLQKPSNSFQKGSNSFQKGQLTDQVQHQSMAISSDMINSLKKSISLQRNQSLKSLDRQENLQLTSKIKHEKATMIKNTKKQNDPSYKIKMNVIYLVLGIIMLWLLYHLMGHDSKVEYSK